MIGIVDYNTGNVGSIANMLRKVGADAVVTSDRDVLEGATALILPGVGHFDEGMRSLDESGLRPLLERRVLGDGVPLLGICLGMQLLTRSSEEGQRPGLGWIAADTLRFQPSGEPKLKIPHMGWNTVRGVTPSPLFEDMEPESRFYFVHSYYVRCDRAEDVSLRVTYGQEFDAAVRRGNIFGTQFHPEKSHLFGMRVMRAFAEHVAC